MSQVENRLSDLLRGAPRSALAAAAGDDLWDWERFAGAAAALTALLDAHDLGPQTRVGVVLRNEPASAATVIGLLATGRCLCTLSPLQPAERLAQDIAASELPVVVAGPDVVADPLVLAAMSAHGLVIRLHPDGSCEALTGAAAPRPERQCADGVAIEMFTSGTTGAPKRVALTYAQLDVSLGSASIAVKTGADGALALASGVSIIAAPLVHIGGLWNLIANTYAGRTVVLLPKFAVDPWVEAVTTYRPAAVALVPAAIRMVLDANVPADKLAGVQVATSGTGPCPVDAADEMLRRYGIRVLMTYGATEFAGALAGWNKRDHVEWWDRKKGSAGKPFPGVAVRVVDAGGGVLPIGEVGTLEVRTRQAANGGADWIRTSDLARLDADDFLWIEGRADDAIVRGGFKVHPMTVRRALESHPAVREAAVTGIPDSRLGAVPVAALVLHPGAPAPTTDEILDAARATLTAYELPARILIVDELPRTPAMKVDQRGLQALFADHVVAAAPGAP